MLTQCPCPRNVRTILPSCQCSKLVVLIKVVLIKVKQRQVQSGLTTTVAQARDATDRLWHLSDANNGVKPDLHACTQSLETWESCTSRRTQAAPPRSRR